MGHGTAGPAGRAGAGPCLDQYLTIDQPNVQPPAELTQSMLAPPPVTSRNFHELAPWDLTLEEAIELSLAHSQVLNKLGGIVVGAPTGTTTVYDPAIQASDPQAGVEAALAAFDTQFTTNLFLARQERKFNNLFFGAGAPQSEANTGNFVMSFVKPTAAGTTFSFRNETTYRRDNSPVNRFRSVYDTTMIVEMRQPLLRGAGTAVNRIAGPSGVPGVYNGVLIARVRADVSLADFEANVRDLVRDVERSYWELYFAYRDFHARVEARDAARETWENRRARLDRGIGRPDEEAQARQQYFAFQAQVENAFSGVLGGQLGVLGAERQLRRLMGLPSSDGHLIRPSTEPSLAPVVLDWELSQDEALQRRVELRRQKWIVRQRELELTAARALNKWRLDLVANYGVRGFGDQLFGQADMPEGSAFADLFQGDLSDWLLGLELQGPIGNRVGNLAQRNAELRLARERALLVEQQRQILHDLNAAYTEVDRALGQIETNYNSRVATQEELEPRRQRVILGEDPVFFLLDTQQRAATAESALHRAIVDYNLALLNYDYASGNLLARYGIVLAEEPWSPAAQMEAATKARRFVHGPSNHQLRDVPPVSAGPYPQ